MIARSIIVLMAELLIFYILGSGFIKLLKQKENFPIGVRIITGFFLYQILFQVMALPFAFLRKRLSLLTLCWDVFLVVVVIIGFFYTGKLIREDILRTIKNIKKHKVILAIMTVIIGAMCWFVSTNGEFNADAEYYIGLVNTTLTSDYLFRFNVYTGELAPSLYLRRALATFEIQAATLCRTFAIEPLILMRIERACLNVVLTSISIYLLGNLCFAKHEKEKRMEKSCILLCLTMLIYWLYDGTIYTNATFLLYRAYEAKAFTGNVIIYFVLYLTISVLMAGKKIYALLLLIVMWGCLAISFSALLVGIGGVSVLVAAYVIMRLYEKYMVKKELEKYND